MTELFVKPQKDPSQKSATNIIQDALKQVAKEGGTIHFSSGAYDVETFSVIPSGVTLDFQDVTIRMQGSGIFLKTLPGTNNVQVLGKLTFAAGPDATAAFAFFASSRISVSVQAVANGLAPGRPFILLDQCQNANVAGSLASQDSRLVSVVDSSSVEISGVRAGPYVADPRDGIVRVLTTGKYGPVANIYLHDIEVDGGNVLASSGMVGVNPMAGPPLIQNVRVERCKVRNSVANVDGVDVSRSIGIVVKDIYAESVNVGVAVVGTHAKVSNIEGHRCRAQAFEYGDPTYQFESISDLEADGILARDCGYGWSGVHSSGVGIFQAPSTTSSDITLRNVDSVDTDGKSQKFGFSMSAGVRSVRIVGGRLRGYSGRFLSLAPPNELTLENVD